MSSDAGDADPIVGQLIDGRYRIIELLGRGGMGSVYKAEHVTIRRIVAIKLLHPVLARVPEVSRRFEREAFAIGRIEHPNCVNVSDFGQLDDGSLFLVMEYLEGHSLGDELAEKGHIDPARALHILRHVLRGLSHAHDNGIVHRDVKPENVVLVEQDGDPDFAKILDFGIAKLVGSAAEGEGGAKLTQAGMAFGTPIYMSPEQAVGNPIDGRADLYAATVMAYEMIAGQPPFQSDDKIEVMSMHTSRPVPPLSEIAPEVYVPGVVERLLQRGLAKRPDDRFADAREYIAAIEHVLAEISAPKMVQLTGLQQVLTPVTGSQQVLLGTGPVPIGTGPVPLGSGPVPAPRQASVPPMYEAMSLPDAEPLPQLKKSRRGLILGALALVGIVLAVAVASGRGRKDVQSGAANDAGAASAADGGRALSLAEQAEGLLDRGAPKEAAALLTENKDEIAKNPQAQIQLGHALAALRSNEAALTAYRAAIDLDPSLRNDPKLRANLGVMRKDDNGNTAIDAILFMLDKLEDESAATALATLASKDKRYDVRHRAIQEAEARSLGDRIDWADSLILDFLQGKTCPDRRKVVPMLRALGDKRAAPVLREAIYKKVTRRRGIYKEVNKCLIEDAVEAIQYLESLGTIDAGPR